MVAAAPRASRRRLLDPEAGTVAMSSVPAQCLLTGWDGPVDLLQLVEPTDPQAVLARLRTAAQARGPLLVYLCGQIARDHRQHQVHLMLAAATPSTIRYQALPWSWLVQELAHRAPGSTAVVADLVADPTSWPLAADELALPKGVKLWGVVAPPARRGPRQAPKYTQALAQLLSGTPGRIGLQELHPVAVGQAGLDQAAVVLSPVHGTAQAPAPVPLPRVEERVLPPMPNVPPPVPVPPVAAPVPDRRPAIAVELQAGRHHAAAALAAEWEREILRSVGRESAAMADVLEVQAHAAVLSGAVVRGAERWLATAEHRLKWQRPDDPQVQAAVDNAHSAWRKLEPTEAAELAPRLLAVREVVPGADGRGLRALRKRLEKAGRPVAASTAWDEGFTPPAAWR